MWWCEGCYARVLVEGGARGRGGTGGSRGGAVRRRRVWRARSAHSIRERSAAITRCALSQLRTHYERATTPARLPPVMLPDSVDMCYRFVRERVRLQLFPKR